MTAAIEKILSRHAGQGRPILNLAQDQPHPPHSRTPQAIKPRRLYPGLHSQALAGKKDPARRSSLRSNSTRTTPDVLRCIFPLPFAQIRGCDGIHMVGRGLTIPQSPGKGMEAYRTFSFRHYLAFARAYFETHTYPVMEEAQNTPEKLPVLIVSFTAPGIISCIGVALASQVFNSTIRKP